jgi:hypothetical protein
MTTRRDFLATTITVPAVLGIGAKALAAPGGSHSPVRPLPIDQVIVDERFAASVEVAALAQQQRVSVSAIQGDVTALWYHELAPRWRNKPMTIAGLTSAGTLFVLERLAWEAGLRVVYRAEHWQIDERTMCHKVTGPIAMRSRAQRLSSAPGAWSHAAAAVLLSGDHAAKRSAPETKRTFLNNPGPATELEGISWVIAPLTKRTSWV